MPGIHATGFMGISHEATFGTFVAASRFFPIKSETLTETRDIQKRRLIRGIVDTIGHLDGNTTVSGEIEMELMEDILPYFLYVSRNSIIKSGAGPYVYTTTPTHWGDHTQLPATKKGMSITVVKNATERFGFTGCIVTSIEITVDNGVPYVKLGILGQAEAVQALPTYVGVATDLPFNDGQFSIELPTASQVFDVENFTFMVNDNGEPQHRLQTVKTAQWLKWGEREVTLQLEKDFATRAEWDIFKALTTQSVTISMTKTATALVTIKMVNAVRNEFTVEGLSDQGTVLKQQVTYEADYDAASSKSYEIICKCLSNIA